MLPTMIQRAPARRRAAFDTPDIVRDFLGWKLADGWAERSTHSAIAADLYETEDGYGLEVDVPGYAEADIEVTVDRGVLTISGTRARTEEEVADRSYHLRERRDERFTRSFALPASIRSEGVTANLEAGVLAVSIPKSPEAKPRRVVLGGARKA